MGRKLCLFSEVRGVVLANGSPAADATVERTWDWGRKPGSDRARTDAEGRFALPAVLRRSLLASILPHEPVIRQEMHIEHGGERRQAWLFVKHNYEVDGERKGRPIRATFHLEAEPENREGIYGLAVFDD
jgi:hypothetical protein